MDDKWKFRRLLIKIYAVAVAVFSLAMLSVMTSYAINKTVIIDDREMSDETETAYEKDSVRWKYEIDSTDNFENEIIIPVQGNSGSSYDTDVRYDLNQIVISFPGEDERFLADNPPFGDLTLVEDAYGEFGDNRATVIFNMKEPVICKSEYQSQIYGGEIRLNLIPLKDNDRPTVLIDPYQGGNFAGIQAGNLLEKEIVLAIAKEIEIQATDKSYEVILTRGADRYISVEEKLDIIKKCSPDAYIGIRLSSDADNIKKFGMYASYNEGYYRHGIQNVYFADKVLKNACEKAKDKGIGLVSATEDDVILMTLDIPGTVFYAGYLSNPDESMLLADRDYIGRVASGVIDALDEIYGE